MKTALITISDRGDLYLPRMRESLAKHVDWKFDQIIEVDDQAHELGMAGAVNAAWSQIGDNIDYAFHVEEDFVFLSDVDIDAMATVLGMNRHLAQMVLKRQPLAPVEVAAGSVLGPHLGALEECTGDIGNPHRPAGEKCRGGCFCTLRDYPNWVEHGAIFSLNPCLYPASITRDGWPAGNEAEFTQRMLDQGRSFAFWGERADAPWVEHIGTQRGAGWKL